MIKKVIDVYIVDNLYNTSLYIYLEGGGRIIKEYKNIEQAAEVMDNIKDKMIIQVY